MNLRPRFLPRASLLMLATSLSTSPAGAQVADQGTLVVRSGGRDIGVETFQVIPTATGLRILSHGVYSSPKPGVELSGSLDRTGDTDVAFQLKRTAGAASGEVYAVIKRNRLTIRRVERGAEQASESHGGPGIVLLADSLFGLYLQILPLATDTGRTLTAVLPATNRRISFTAQRSPAPEPGASMVRLGGGLVGEIQLGRSGEIIRISLPGLGLEALRKRD